MIVMILVHHALELGNSNVGDVWPLDEKRRLRLQTSYRDLIEMLDPNNGLVDTLFSRECITLRHKHRIEAGRTDEEKSQVLIDILRLRSVEHFDKFVACLNEQMQHHLVPLLTDDQGNVIIIVLARCNNELLSNIAMSDRPINIVNGYNSLSGMHIISVNITV